ncbi:SDR family NAD(P)-dependent oxidoreductase [Mycobacterium sp. MMS18-G62]
MSHNLVIVGAGAGFARATARAFGSNDWDVQLVARNSARLEKLVQSLRDDGVRCEAHVGDVTRHEELSRLVVGLDDRQPIDAVIYQPRGDDSIVDVRDATVANVAPHLTALVLGAVAVGEILVKRMVARGRGSLVFVGGGSARLPLPMFGNLGPAMAGLRNYALTLGASLSDTGVHSAFYTAAGAIGIEGQVREGELDPQALADRMYTLVTAGDTKEVLMTPGGEVVPKGAR